MGLEAEIEALKQDLFDQWIVVHDLNPSNILVQRQAYDRYRLVVIDGVGHNHFIPLASYSPGFARKKLTRVWNRRFHQWYSAFPAVLKLLKPMSDAVTSLSSSRPGMSAIAFVVSVVLRNSGGTGAPVSANSSSRTCSVR